MQHGDEGLTGSEWMGGTMQPDPSQGINYYSILDVDPGAPRVAIREAYLRLKSAFGVGSAALYSLMSEDEAADQVAQIEAAFRVLGDDLARRAYDLELGIGAAGPLRQGAVLGDGRGFQDELTRPLAELAGPSAGQAIDSERPDHDRRAVRSNLPLIKLRATCSGDEAVQAKLREIISSSDPSDGDLLRLLREACGVSEAEICDSTKVSRDYLQAIETGRFERLPQAVFVKGFLRSFCRYLCVPDPEVIVTAFSARLTDWQSNRKV